MDETRYMYIVSVLSKLTVSLFVQNQRHNA